MGSNALNLARVVIVFKFSSHKIHNSALWLSTLLSEIFQAYFEYKGAQVLPPFTMLYSPKI